MSMRLNSSFPKKYRVFTRWVVLVFALSLLLGAAFVFAELHHNCSGEDCAICAAVAHTVSFLKAETAALALPVAFAVCLFIAPIAGEYPTQAFTEASSLVSLKVKLSD